MEIEIIWGIIMTVTARINGNSFIFARQN